MTDRALGAVTLREKLVLAAALALAIAVLPLSGGSVLWTRPLWLDEVCCTFYPTSTAATPVEVIRNVAREDYAPPVMHLMVWTAGKIAGGITPTVIRSVSLACVSLALALLYLSLRRRFDQASSVAGALAVATHALVLRHAFEGRFYGPWLLFAVAFAWSLTLGEAKGLLQNARSFAQPALSAANVLRMTTIAVCSVLLVMVHWFAILSLGLMVVAVVASYGRRWRESLRLVAPSAAGILLLTACIPVALSHRANAVAKANLWVPALSLDQVMVIGWLFFLTAVPLLAAALIVLSALRTGAKQTLASVREAALDPGLVALASLALMPLPLIVVSVVLQPSLLDRYAIVTVLAWAPLVALAVSTLGRVPRMVALAVLLTLVARNTREAIAERRAFAGSVAATQAAFTQATATRLPIVFPSLLALYPLGGPTRDQTLLFLDLPDSTISALVPQPRLEWLRRNIATERNIARGHHLSYGFPSLATQSQLDTTRRFLLVASDADLPRLYQRVDLFTTAVFPHHRLTRVTPNLALLER